MGDVLGSGSAGGPPCRLLALLVGLLASALAACTPAAGRDADKVTLRVVLADDWAPVDAVLDAVRTFEAANPTVRVDVEGLPFASIATAVDTAIRAGDPHDLAQWHAFAAGAWGIGEPLDDLWDRHLDPDDFLPGAIEDVVWAGVRYGVPLDTNAMVLVANADHLELAGVGEGGFTDMAAFEAALDRLTPPFGGRRAMAHSLSSWSAYGWIRAHGGEVVEVADDGTPTFLLDDPATVAALDFLGRTVVEGLAHEPGTRNRSAAMVDLFLEGRTSLIATGAWDLVASNDAARRAGQDAPRAVALPVPGVAPGTGRGTALGGSSLFVPIGSENRELAFEFAMHLIEDPTALALALDEGRLPVRRRVFDDPSFDEPTMQVVRDHLELASPMKLIAFEEAQDAFGRALEDVLTGRSDAATALARAQREAEASLDGTSP